MGLELDKAFNENKDKTREGQGDMCMAHAHNVTKIHRRRNGNRQKRFLRIL